MAVYDVGPVEEFAAGTKRLITIGRLEVGVYNVDGRFYAVPNRCPHQQGPLCAGPTTGEWRCNDATGWKTDFGRRGEILVCPWHGMEFDLPTGRCLSSERLRVRSFPVTVADGRVTVSTERG